MNFLLKRNQQNRHNSSSLSKKERGHNHSLKFLQQLGKTLQYPISILPFAAILMRFGTLGVTLTSTDYQHITNHVGYWISWVIQQPGQMIFDNLALFFALGVAFGLVDDHRAEAAITGGILYIALTVLTKEHGLPELLYKNVLQFKDGGGHGWTSLTYVPVYADDGKTITSVKYILNIGVFGGIFSGVLAANMYKRFKGIIMPRALNFFGGRRFPPMLALASSIPLGFCFSVIWPWIQYGLMQFGRAIADPNNPAVAIPGTAAYGLINRLLQPFGLHQILNTFFWFQLPIYGVRIAPITGKVISQPMWVNGDVSAFALGIKGSGLFQSGFYPTLMGGLTGVAFAMLYGVPKKTRKNYVGFFMGAAIISALTGVTEVVEFSFVFISPLLWLIHAGLTCVFVGITTALHIQVGFGFSTGFIDYIVSFVQSWGLSNANSGVYHITSNPLWLLVLSLIAGGLYFVIFYPLIFRFDIKTPGRDEAEAQQVSANVTKSTDHKTKGEKYRLIAEKLIAAIGNENLVEIDNCASRLRLTVKDASKINDAAVKASGAYGMVKLTNEAVQIIIGPDVEHVTNFMREIHKK